MERIRSIIILLLFSSLFLNASGQSVFEDVPTSYLPSEETYQAIENTSGVPGLRAKPGDIGSAEKPQKVPLAEADLTMIT